VSAGPPAAATPPRALPLRNATLYLGGRALATSQGLFTLHLFRDLVAGRVAMVLACGDLATREPLLARVHSSCLTSECLMGCDCDCADQLEGALARIALEGRGAVVYLLQEGRGAGLSAKARDRMLVQASGSRLTTFDAYAAMGLPPDLRRYDAVASMLAMLGVRAPLRLLTNNPDKIAAVARALGAEKIEVAGSEPIAGRHSVWNRDYLRAKRSSGHVLERLDHGPGERPPERVCAFDPVVHGRDAERLVTASYFLPIALPSIDPPGRGEGRASGKPVVWFRSSVLVERATGRESIVLSQGDAAEPEAIGLPDASAWIPLALLDRLPTAEATGRRRLAEALAAIRARGAGRVGVVWNEASLEPTPAAHGSQGSDVAG
jgi:GTP cyclohydrolase II